MFWWLCEDPAFDGLVYPVYIVDEGMAQYLADAGGRIVFQADLVIPNE